MEVSFCKLLHDNYNTCRVLQYIYTENTTMGTCSVFRINCVKHCNLNIKYRNVQMAYM